METIVENFKTRKKNTRKQKTLKVYIIREVSFENVVKSLKDFQDAQLLLKKNGFMVMNPLNPTEIENMLSNKKTPHKLNLDKLFASDAVFVLPDVTRTGKSNMELKIAFELDLFIFMSSTF